MAGFFLTVLNFSLVLKHMPYILFFLLKTGEMCIITGVLISP